MNRVDPPARRSHADRWLWTERLFVLAVIAVGFFLRFYQLDTIPPGLRYDEAYNGVDALRILDGARPIFLPGNFGREALFIYAQALSVGIVGPTGFALRVVAAICGILTLPAAYILARRLFNRRVALLTVAWLAISLWHVIFSRIGLRTIALPLAAGVTLYCLTRGVEPLWTDHDEERLAPTLPNRGKPRIPWLALAGIFLGVSLYTYTAARFLPFVVVGFIVYVSLICPQSRKTALESLVFVGLIAFLVFVPEGLYFARHPDTFFQRASAVSIFNPGVNGGSATGALIYSTERSFGMFVAEGDDNWDRNIPGQPVFDPLSAVFFGIGFIRILRAPRHPPNALPVIWVLVMLVPGILAARDVPNFLHYTGILPGLYMIPALGGEALWEYWECRGVVVRRLLPLLVFSVGFLAGTGRVYRAYFGTWAHSSDVAFLFDADRYLTLETGRAMAQASGKQVIVGAGDPLAPSRAISLPACRRLGWFGHLTAVIP